MSNEIDIVINIINRARNVLQEQATAIINATTNINESFAHAINIILCSPGKVIVSAIGKPGYIARKISATLSSTGTPSFFLHPAEALHGDLGRVSQEDVMLILSNSGETAEIINMLPTLKRIGVTVISLCGNPESTLAKHSDVVISSKVEYECCPLNLAPTTSTTLALATGDAIAIALMEARSFTKQHFAFYHPGGTLGRKRLLTVEKVMRKGEKACLISRETTIIEALFTMTRHFSGAVVIVNPENNVEGIITDGDIRRYVMYNNLFLQAAVTEIINTSPVCISQHQLVEEALCIMEKHRPAPISVLPVLNDRSQAVGLLYLTDLLSNMPS